MKKPDNKGIVRTERLGKGYKTRLKALIKKKGFGAIEIIATETGLHRDTVTRARNTGRLNKTNRRKIEAYIDAQSKPKTAA